MQPRSLLVRRWPPEFAGPGVKAAWAKAGVETKKRILRLLIEGYGFRVTIRRVGPGNGASYDPQAVAITWRY